MLLKDMLTEDALTGLMGMKTNNEKKKTGSKNKKQNKNKKTYSNKAKGNAKKTNIPQNKKRTDKSSEYREERRIRRYIDECQYCASDDLEMTANNYYYCNICGFKIEKVY